MAPNPTSPHSGESATQGGRGPGLSVGHKLAIGTIAVVTLVCGCVYFALTAHERTSLFRSKELAASMVTKLFASSLGAVVQFADQQGLSDSLAQLRQNPDVDATAVFKVLPNGTHERLGEFARKHVPTITVVPQLQPGSSSRQAGRLVLAEDIIDPQGERLGRVVAVFSLAREEATFARLKQNILLSSAAAALLLVGVLMVLARRIVVRPMSQLGAAARALGSGTKMDLVINTRDEVGDLSRAFSSMAAAISDREQRIAGRNRDMKLVLDNVGQGFFVVDAKGVLVGERSAVLTTWIGSAQPGQYFWSYLSALDARKCLWIEALWPTLAEDFLPIEMALQQFPERLSSGGRHFEITYRPIMEEGVAHQFIVVLTDVTAAVAHEEAERDQRQLLELFKRFMASRTVFNDFMKEATDLVGYVVNAQNTDQTLVTRALHTLKGNAGSFGITGVAELCHTLESRIVEGGEVPLPQERAQLQSSWAVVQTAAEQLLRTGRDDTLAVTLREYNAFRAALVRDTCRDNLLEEMDRWRLVPTGQRLEALAETAKSLATRLDKGPIEVFTEDNGVRLPADGWSSFWGGLIHVIRNAVDHGLESKQEREALGKPARITISTAYDGGKVVVSVSDTGRGIAWDKVAERSRRLGMPATTQDDLVAALFADGLTTRDEATDISGRGVGLAAVRETVLQAGGNIAVESTPGVGTTFLFVFPTPHIHTQIAAA